MRVCVIGTGYVGLVTGACLAHIGHQVIGVDNNSKKINFTQFEQSPIYESELSEIMQSAMIAGRLLFTTDFRVGVEHGEVLFITVETPSLSTGERDTRYVEAVARGIGIHLPKDYKVIVNKSRVPIGSEHWIRQLILDELLNRQQYSDTQIFADFDVVSQPEFIQKGSDVYDIFNADRLVLGSNEERAIAVMKALYTPIINRQFAEDKSLPPIPIMVEALSSDERIKHTVNTF